MRPTIAWEEDVIVMIDQRRLPREEIYLRCRDHLEVAAAIRDMAIRGAPAIGIAAAMAVALGMKRHAGQDVGGRERAYAAIHDVLAETRPTAVNLFWALERMRRRFAETRSAPKDALDDTLRREALAIEAEDLDACRRMGELGAALVPERARILTHCNAGGLATAGHGTALGVVRSAARLGKVRMVFADETRPFLQGARLTAWELLRDGIPTTVITDGMAGHFMARGEIDLVVVGADRIAMNGDVANKIGTYSLAVLAREHGLPFFVVAPTSTFDPETPNGSGIPIEERPQDEVLRFAGTSIAPEGALARHPAFDVTPHRLVTAVICERGVARPPFAASLSALLRKEGA
ncbi:MAG: S-methyl-5-thioribose-1-phosphate isomerase [Vicinamibacteria bacterium]|nr:S-methyl-5-thioribose-1-phosphate isomerase [Vicinamibacteria bacterium]